jgi:hypothetical protein
MVDLDPDVTPEDSEARRFHGAKKAFPLVVFFANENRERHSRPRYERHGKLSEANRADMDQQVFGHGAEMLITPAYARENARLHTVDPTYGVEGHLWAYLISGIARMENCRSVLDYGCGKGTLAKALAGTDLCVTEYDPAIPSKDTRQPNSPTSWWL